MTALRHALQPRWSFEGLFGLVFHLAWESLGHHTVQPLHNPDPQARALQPGPAGQLRRESVPHKPRKTASLTPQSFRHGDLLL